MKAPKLIALTAFALLFSQCKTTAPTAPESSESSLFEVNAILDSAESHFILYANTTNGDPVKSLDFASDWLQSQPNVKDAYVVDNAYVDILLNSGLETYFGFDQVDDNGHSIFRGGGSNRTKGEYAQALDATLSTHTITSKKVLLFASAGFDLVGVIQQLPKTINLLSNSGLGLEVTLLTDSACTYGAVATFGDYGLVIIDTHGRQNAFLVGSTLDLTAASTNPSVLTNRINQILGIGTTSKLVSGSLKLGASLSANPKRSNWQKNLIPSSGRELYVSSKYLALLPPMPNTVIFGNMCYSGFTAATYTTPARIDTLPQGVVAIPAKTRTVDGPIGAAFIAKNPISYYGYARNIPSGTSTLVPDPFASSMEDALVRRLVNGDSTQLANLQADNSSEFFTPPEPDDPIQQNLYLRHFGADDYSYLKCGAPFTDPRDGQTYKTVCIGDQTWMAENLDYDAPGSHCYGDVTSNCSTYGRFYNWSTLTQGAAPSSANPSGVQGVCPKGWHVPSVAEWTQLINFLGGPSVAGGALKDTILWNTSGKAGTNSSGFSALPAGSGDLANSTPWDGNIGYEAAFGTASPNSSNVVQPYFFIYLTSSTVSIVQGSVSPTAETSCRCVKDP